jgi:hypothetical protein
MALFFAADGASDDGHVWIVNAFRLNASNGASASPRILLVGMDELPDYVDCFVRAEERQPWPWSKPIFVQVPWVSDRVLAQQGFFTIHPDETPLDEASPRWVRRVDIPRDALAGARDFLHVAGINASVAFPDLQGLAQHLKGRYGV